MAKVMLVTTAPEDVEHCNINGRPFNVRKDYERLRRAAQACTYK
jgi:hypothetical protein